VLLRLAYLAVTNTFAALRLLPMSDRDKDAEILALRHQVTILQRQLGPDKVRFTAEDRAFLAALLQPLPREVLRRLRLIIRSDTILRWHRARRTTGGRLVRSARAGRVGAGPRSPAAAPATPRPWRRHAAVATPAATAGGG
jgi:hypothetical protein